jgi:hypothetical protein
MNLFHRVALIFGLAIVLSAQGLVLAQDEIQPPPPDQPERDRDRQSPRQRLLRRYDTDGDGRISDAERDAARQAAAQRRVLVRIPLPDAQRDELRAAADDDDDGELNRAERRAYWRELIEATRSHHEAIIAEYDQDANGKLDEVELEALRKDQERKRFAAMDADDDGRLTFDEWYNARREAEAEQEQQRREWIERRRNREERPDRQLPQPEPAPDAG